MGGYSRRKSRPTLPPNDRDVELLSEVAGKLHLAEEVALILQEREKEIYPGLESILLEFGTELTRRSSEQKILENMPSTKSSNMDEISRVEAFNNQVEDWAYTCVATKTCYSEKSQAFTQLMAIAQTSIKYNNFNTAFSIVRALRSPLLQNLQESHLAKFNQLKTDLRTSYTHKLMSSVCSKGFPGLAAILPLLNQLGAIFNSCAFILVTSASLEYTSLVVYTGQGTLSYKLQAPFYDFISKSAVLSSPKSADYFGAKKRRKTLRNLRTVIRVVKKIDQRLNGWTPGMGKQKLKKNVHNVKLVNFPATSSLHTNLQVCHSGTTVINMDHATHQTNMVTMRLESCNGVLTWSPINSVQTQNSRANQPGRELMSPGLKMKYTSQTGQNITYLDEGFLDLSTIRLVETANVDLNTYTDQTRESILACYEKEYMGISIVYGTTISNNRCLTFLCPTRVGNIWLTVLKELVKELERGCLKLRWLKDQFLYLYYQDELCMGPLGVDAIKVFGGRNWSILKDKQESKIRRISHVKKKSYGNIHSIKDRGIHELTESNSPAASPQLHRKSIAGPVNIGLGSLLNSRVDVIQEDPTASPAGMFGGGSIPGCPLDRSVTHGKEMTFVDFMILFQEFRYKLRKDLQTLFSQHSVASNFYRVSRFSRSESHPFEADQCLEGEESLTRPVQLNYEEFTWRSHRREFYWSPLAKGSIINYDGKITKGLEMPAEGFMSFLKEYQGENISLEQAVEILSRFEPDPRLRAREVLSYEGFASYLMDAENDAVQSHQGGIDQDMNHPLSHYYIASSHNTYLTGHQLKGQSSVELYRQILLTGCRCVELDCWDGEDGTPIIFHGHTLTSKISFHEVVKVIEKSAFVATPYPLILSIENHCSINQQKKMAAIFKDVLKDKLLVLPVDDKETVLPSPENLKYKIIIKNKKLKDTEVEQVRTSFEQEEDFDSDFDEEMIESASDEEETEEVDGLGLGGLPLEFLNIQRQRIINEDLRSVDSSSSPQPSQTKSNRGRASVVDSPMTYRRKAMLPKQKRKKIQVAEELSDLVVYCQSRKFKDFKDNDRSDSPALHNQRMRLNDGSPVHTQIQSPAEREAIYSCSSIHENRAKSVARKTPLKLLNYTERYLVRCYPAGMRIDSSNFNPVTMWAVGIHMVALNYQTSDFNQLMNLAFFSQNGSCGYVLKPRVMWDTDHILFSRFNPFSKEIFGLHSTTIEITVMSGLYVCEQDYQASPVVEIEVIGIPADCCKYKTKMSPRNALSPMWNDTFEIEVRLPELALLRLTVVDLTTNVATAQRIIPLQQLRQGYRTVPLKDMKGKSLPLSSLFIFTVFHKDSIPRDEIPSAESLQQKRMSFLLIHNIGEQDPYAIVKVTNESTAQDVIKMALEKVGKANYANEFVLLEEKLQDGELQQIVNTNQQQRLVGMEEIPLMVKSQWSAIDGKFVLKRVGEDPSWRARLGTNMITKERKISMMPGAGGPPGSGIPGDLETTSTNNLAGDNPADTDPETADNFLVCIFNVSPGMSHMILQVSKRATAQQIITAALTKCRRVEEPARFVLMEETESTGELGGKKKVGKKVLQQRLLADDENVYMIQNRWIEKGKFILLERDKNLHRLHRGLESSHPGIRETQSEPIGRGSLPNSPRLRRPNNIVGRVRKFSRSLYANNEDNSDGAFLGVPGLRHPVSPAPIREVITREAHSDGELSDDEETMRMRKTSMANLRKLKIW